MHHQREMKCFHIVFNIYWLYQGILNFVYRQFINSLTNSVQDVVRKSGVTKYFDRLIILDYVRPTNLTEAPYSYKQ
jgi:hypothetical protein